MKTFTFFLLAAMLTSCSYKLVPKPGPYFAYKQAKEKQAKMLAKDSITVKK